MIPEIITRRSMLREIVSIGAEEGIEETYISVIAYRRSNRSMFHILSCKAKVCPLWLFAMFANTRVDPQSLFL